MQSTKVCVLPACVCMSVLSLPRKCIADERQTINLFEGHKEALLTHLCGTIDDVCVPVEQVGRALHIAFLRCIQQLLPRI